MVRLTPRPRKLSVPYGTGEKPIFRCLLPRTAQLAYLGQRARAIASVPRPPGGPGTGGPSPEYRRDHETIAVLVLVEVSAWSSQRGCAPTRGACSRSKAVARGGAAIQRSCIFLLFMSGEVLNGSRSTPRELRTCIASPLY